VKQTTPQTLPALLDEVLIYALVAILITFNILHGCG